MPYESQLDATVRFGASRVRSNRGAWLVAWIICAIALLPTHASAQVGLDECVTDADCTDENFCNGVERCFLGFCELGGNPCPGQQCDETTDTCVDCLSGCAEASPCIAARQNANGSWGDEDGTALRDTAVVLDALRFLGQKGTQFARGLNLLEGSGAPNQDYLSRQIVSLAGAGSDVSSLSSLLVAGQSSESLDPAGPSYPEGGWGIAAGFDTDVLTTALALSALRASAPSTGLSVVQAAVLAGTPNAHPFGVPAGGSALRLFIRQVTGSVRLFIDTPSSGTFSVTLTNVTSPTSLTGLPTQAGIYTLRVQSLSGSPNTYSLEARFSTADGFDAGRITRALSYLGFAQNADGSWGIRRGEDGLLAVTAEVLQTLEGFGASFAPQSAIDRGLAWLEARQNADGGFGDVPGPSAIYDTALSLLAIAGGEDSSPAIGPARDYLTGSRDASGCWDDDPYQTALALRVLADLCRLDVDANGVADVATDVVYVARMLAGINPTVPPSFRTLDPTIPPDSEIEARIEAATERFDVDGNDVTDVATDVVYVARRKVAVAPTVPPSFRALDPTIPADGAIEGRINILCR